MPSCLLSFLSFDVNTLPFHSAEPFFFNHLLFLSFFPSCSFVFYCQNCFFFPLLLGGQPRLHPGFCFFECPSVQPAYKSSLPAGVTMAEVTTDGAMLAGLPHPPNGIGQGAETFTCHHAAGRGGTSIGSSRLSL